MMPALTLEQLPTEPSDLLALYAQGASLLAAAVRGWSPAELAARPFAGKWTAHETVCHVSDFELVNAERLRRILTDDQPVLPDGDPDRFSARLGYARRDVGEELALVAAVRRQTSRILHSVDAAAWLRQGHHSSAGPLSLRDVLRRVTWHLPHHLDHVARIAAALPSSVAAAPGDKAHHATISWRRAEAESTPRYSRAHTWTFEGGLVVAASPSPHVVARPAERRADVDPEEALVASIASCHMLSFLWQATQAGLEPESYHDAARGTMTPNEHGVPWLSHTTLQPKVTWRDGKQPDAAQLAALHEAAHHGCYIANSVRTAIAIMPE